MHYTGGYWTTRIEDDAQTRSTGVQEITTFYGLKSMNRIWISSAIGDNYVISLFPGISREIPVFPTVPGNTLISRLFDNPGSN